MVVATRYGCRQSATGCPPAPEAGSFIEGAIKPLLSVWRRPLALAGILLLTACSHNAQAVSNRMPASARGRRQTDKRGLIAPSIKLFTATPCSHNASLPPFTASGYADNQGAMRIWRKDSGDEVP
jgi:hypothetical protein